MNMIKNDGRDAAIFCIRRIYTFNLHDFSYKLCKESFIFEVLKTMEA